MELTARIAVMRINSTLVTSDTRISYQKRIDIKSINRYNLGRVNSAPTVQFLKLRIRHSESLFESMSWEKVSVFLPTPPFMSHNIVLLYDRDSYYALGLLRGCSKLKSCLRTV